MTNISLRLHGRYLRFGILSHAAAPLRKPRGGFTLTFEKFYGAEFKEIIEVHHIVPVSQIGEAYVVDPIKDLIPVCPNCHAVLHSKKNSVYASEELHALLKSMRP